MENNRNILAEALMKRKKKKKFVDSEGKEWDLSQFDDTRSWSKTKDKK
mgnify:CR=1 FL=1